MTTTPDPENVTPALDDVTNGDDFAGEPVEAEHDLDVSTFDEES